MKAPLAPRLTWTQRPGETVLREIVVDTAQRGRGEGKRPQYFYLVWMLLLAGYLLWKVAGDLRKGGWDWPSLFGGEPLLGLLGLLGAVVALGLFAVLLNARRPSPWLDMERYVFTDQRICLLDPEGRVMDGIKASEIDDIILTAPRTGRPPYSVDCLRADDPDLKRMFSILYVDDLEDVFDFVKSNYS
jgi:hypothetical protein